MTGPAVRGHRLDHRLRPGLLIPEDDAGLPVKPARSSQRAHGGNQRAHEAVMQHGKADRPHGAIRLPIPEVVDLCLHVRSQRQQFRRNIVCLLLAPGRHPEDDCAALHHRDPRRLLFLALSLPDCGGEQVAGEATAFLLQQRQRPPTLEHAIDRRERPGKIEHDQVVKRSPLIEDVAGSLQIVEKKHRR